MRYSKMLIPTLREDPSDAEVPSHKLMIRAGLIRKVAAGIYSFLPLGLRSLKKVETIIREEMDRAGGQELLLPALQPAELWKESKRWDYYGPELIRLKDRHDHEFCLGPTHEEVITDLVRREVKSYRDLPLCLYQIQTKFRDEIRPRFGIMRGREFGMKDAYSFDVDEKESEKSYKKMYDAYSRIFKRCGLKFKAVEADTGAIGGSFSHEFMVLANTGEDTIVSCTECEYAANLEKAEVKLKDFEEKENRESIPDIEEVPTPDAKTIEEVTSFLKVDAKDLIKTIIYITDKGPVAGLVRGDYQISPAKLRQAIGADTLELADPATIQEITGAPVGFAGPIGLSIPIIADFSLKEGISWVTGANKKDMHLRNVVIGRDFEINIWADIREITKDDPCPKCGAKIEIMQGIEVGHVFKLGTKYSEAMGATYQNRDGKEIPIFMGCYGIGVGRTLAACIEQYHDDAGIIFPLPIAPFQVIILPLQMKDENVVNVAEKIYEDLWDANIDVLIDDRNERPGIKFKDADLIGIPFRIVVSNKVLKDGNIELRRRRDGEVIYIPVENVNEDIKCILEKEAKLYEL